MSSPTLALGAAWVGRPNTIWAFAGPVPKRGRRHHESTADNFVRPVLSRYGKLRMAPFLLLIAMLGGLQSSVPGGVALGPLLVRLAVEGTSRFCANKRHNPPARLSLLRVTFVAAPRPVRRLATVLFAASIATTIAVANRGFGQPRGPMPKPEMRPKYSPWQSTHHSWMTQFATVFGIIYLRPRATIGYGAPFWQFVGVDAWWMTNTAFSAAYLGWRANLPWLDVQIGGRKVYPFNRRLLPIRRSHNGDDLAFGTATCARSITPSISRH